MSATETICECGHNRGEHDWQWPLICERCSCEAYRPASPVPVGTPAPTYLEAGGERVQVIGSALTDARDKFGSANIQRVADMVETYLTYWDMLNVIAPPSTQPRTPRMPSTPERCTECGHDADMHIGRCLDTRKWRNYVRGKDMESPCDCRKFVAASPVPVGTPAPTCPKCQTVALLQEDGGYWCPNPACRVMIIGSAPPAPTLNSSPVESSLRVAPPAPRSETADIVAEQEQLVVEICAVVNVAINSAESHELRCLVADSWPRAASPAPAATPPVKCTECGEAATHFGHNRDAAADWRYHKFAAPSQPSEPTADTHDAIIVELLDNLTASQKFNVALKERADGTEQRLVTVTAEKDRLRATIQEYFASKVELQWQTKMTGNADAYLAAVEREKKATERLRLATAPTTESDNG